MTKGEKAVHHAYRITFGSQHGQVVLADLAGMAAVAGDGAGKMIAYIVARMTGNLAERAEQDDATEPERE